MYLADLAGYGAITIQCHDVPDADAIASGFALKEFLESRGASVRLIYSGSDSVIKPDLLSMLEFLNIPLEYVNELPDCRLLITVDSQYGGGNIKKFDAEKIAVFDHHRPEIPEGPDIIINPSLGSCSTLIWDLLSRENFNFASHMNVGTALYYGLFADTNGLAELRHPKDRDLADFRAVNRYIVRKLKYSSLTIEDLKIVANALSSPRLVGKIGLLKAEPCDTNLLGFSSDIARSVKQFDCSVVYCCMPGGFKISIRSTVREMMSNELATFLVKDVGSGGGNIEKAGGYIGYTGLEKVFPGVSPEEFLVNRIEEYQANYDHVYSENHNLRFDSMPQFRKLKVPVGFTPSTTVFPDGTPITVRTLESDIDLNASYDIYLMIGVAGEVYPIKKAKHEQDYDVHDKPCKTDTEYEPVVINRINGMRESLFLFARVCVPKEEKLIRACKLTRNTKVFTVWDEEKYFCGQAGDYIAAPEPTWQKTPRAKYNDVYIIRRDIFEKTYKQVS